jgi:8-oxo-dGTP diphosphatase
MGTETVVRAAGGVVWRPGPDGVPEVAVVHRPAYEDWSLPKGKLLEGEREDEAALREVREETGFLCTLERALSTNSYRDRRGRPKVVSYWAMRPVRGRFRPSKEVDELRWLPLPEALRLLTYDHDRALLRELDQAG